MSHEDDGRGTGGGRDSLLDRRDLLRRGTALGAAAAIAPYLSAMARGAEPEAPEAAPILHHDPVCDARIHHIHPLEPPAEEDCEIAMGFVWYEFGREAWKKKAVDVTLEAVAYAREGIRPTVRAAMTNGPQDYITKTWPTHRAKWLQLAGEASDGGGIIDVRRMADAWAKVYGAPPSEEDILPLAHRATEVIGGHMWYRYAIGTKEKPLEDAAVFASGRAHSRYWVDRNVRQECIQIHPDTGEEYIDYGRWPWVEVGTCCRLAGVRSSTDAGSGPISTTIFHVAWCHQAEQMSQRAQKDPRFKTSGCGS